MNTRTYKDPYHICTPIEGHFLSVIRPSVQPLLASIIKNIKAAIGFIFAPIRTSLIL